MIGTALAVWHSRNGHLRVFWRNYRQRSDMDGWLAVIEIEPELTAAIEAQVISAYEDAKAAAKKQSEKGRQLERA